MPLGTMAFNMDLTQFKTDELLNMMDSPTAGMYFGGGFCTREMFGPEATSLRLEKILAMYSPKFLVSEDIEDQEMHVVEFNAKENVPKHKMGKIDIPVYPKMTIWIGKEDLFPHRMIMCSDTGDPVMETIMKKYRFNLPFEDSIFNLEIPEGVNVMDMTPFMSTVLKSEDTKVETTEPDADKIEIFMDMLHKKPDMAIDTALPRIHKKAIESTKDFRRWRVGKNNPAVVIIWSFKDLSSKLFLPELAVLHQMAKDKQFEFINILVDKEWEPVLQMIEKYDIPVTVYQAKKDDMTVFGARSYPSIYIFDEEHYLVWCDAGINAWTGLFNETEMHDHGIDYLDGSDAYRQFLTTLRQKIVRDYFQFLQQKKEPALIIKN
jgi:hypothetical protein